MGIRGRLRRRFPRDLELSSCEGERFVCGSTHTRACRVIRERLEIARALPLQQRTR